MHTLWWYYNSCNLIILIFWPCINRKERGSWDKEPKGGRDIPKWSYRAYERAPIPSGSWCRSSATTASELGRATTVLLDFQRSGWLYRTLIRFYQGCQIGSVEDFSVSSPASYLSFTIPPIIIWMGLHAGCRAIKGEAPDIEGPVHVAIRISAFFGAWTRSCLFLYIQSPWFHSDCAPFDPWAGMITCRVRFQNQICASNK
jgi:hypothetical protein